MAVRELVENAFDACELAGSLPDIYVRIIPQNQSMETTDPAPYRLTVTDNGPGVDPQHVPSAFGKVFYGSKYALRQSRGMFGLGGTMAILYGQITTNTPVKITTSTDGQTKHFFEMLIDIAENRPVVLKRETSKANGTTGTRVELTLEGDYLRASPKITDYFKQTAMMAAYANLTFVGPSGQVTLFERVTDRMPPAPKETLPHPYGIDVEAFKRIVKLAGKEDMKTFMVTHFHRVGDKIATRFLEFAGIDPTSKPKDLSNQQIVAVVDALQRFPDFLQPDASVLSPVGEEILLAGINKELNPEFSTLVTRPPSSYSGFPFLVEVGIAYGGKVLQPGVKLFRFANRIPLLYDESSDVSFKILNEEVDWRRYHVPQDAPVAVVTHICLPEYEKVLADIDGRLSYIKIGSLIDDEVRRSRACETRDGVTYATPTRAIKVPSVNQETLRIEYVPVKRLMRRPGGSILRITSEEGRVLNVSPEHPVLTLSGHKIVTKEARRLVDGDYLVAAKSIPRPDKVREVTSLDLVDGLAAEGLTDEVTVVGGKELLYSAGKSELASVLRTSKRQVDNWRRYDRMPLRAYLKLERNATLRRKIKLLGRRSHGTPIPALIELDRGFARLLGFYLAEGCSSLSTNNFVSFSFHKDEASYQDEVIANLARIFGVRPTVDVKKKDKAVQITAYNKALALFFLRVLRAGSDSYAKSVPDFVFSANEEFIRNVLDTYFAGDGYLHRPTRKIQASSASYDLVQGLFVLLRMNGLPSSVYKFGNNYRLDLHGGEEFQDAKQTLIGLVRKKEAESLTSLEYRPSIPDRIPVSVFEKNGRYPGALTQHVGGRFSIQSRVGDATAMKLDLVDASTRMFLEGDIQFVRVKKVEVQDYQGSYYNIETARETLPNYMHGFGIFSHNCSTRIPYKTVGKEYIADRPEIERDLKNAAREALRRLGLFLSKKGSMEAVQRKMNIYGKYLPLIARFSMELADEKRMPRYRKLIGEGPREAATKPESEPQPAPEVPAEGVSKEIEQKKIDEFS